MKTSRPNLANQNIRAAPAAGSAAPTAGKVAAQFGLDRELGGQLKRWPSSLREQAARAFAGQASPLEAIHACCLDCQAFVPALVERCSLKTCPLWRYRPGAAPLPLPESKPTV